MNTTTKTRNAAKRTMMAAERKLTALCLERGVLMHQPMTDANSVRISQLGAEIEATIVARNAAKTAWLSS